MFLFSGPYTATWDLQTWSTGSNALLPNSHTPSRHLRPLKQKHFLLLQQGQAVLTPVGALSELWVTSVGHLHFAKSVTVSCSKEIAYYRCQSCGSHGNLSVCQVFILNTYWKLHLSSDAYLDPTACIQVWLFHTASASTDVFKNTLFHKIHEH